MTRLTMHAKGGMPSKSAEFVPPRQSVDPRPQRGFALPLWAVLAGGGLFLAMFTALVVLSTLMVVQSRETTRLQAAMALNEPAAPPLAVAPQVSPEPEVSAQPAAAEVTRTEVNLLAAEAEESVPARAEPEVAEVALNARIQPPSCVDYLDTLVKITHVRFPLGSNEPAAADLPRVRNMATALRLCPEVKVIVEGHSDRRGGDKLNMDLSWYRAETVLDILRSEGFDTARMEPLGFGARQPINLSGTVSGEGENRRVQFQLVPHDMVIEGLVRN